MNCKEAYEKWKHLDAVLPHRWECSSDETEEDKDVRLKAEIRADLWEAVKTEAQKSD